MSKRRITLTCRVMRSFSPIRICFFSGPLSPDDLGLPEPTSASQLKNLDDPKRLDGGFHDLSSNTDNRSDFDKAVSGPTAISTELSGWLAALPPADARGIDPVIVGRSVADILRDNEQTLMSDGKPPFLLRLKVAPDVAHGGVPSILTVEDYRRNSGLFLKSHRIA